METKNAKRTNGMFEETGKAGEHLNDATSTMINLYKKQLDSVFGFYNNIFNSATGAGKSNGNFNWGVNPFLTASNGHKSFLSPFPWLGSGGDYKEQLTSLYQNYFKQISEFNKSWLDSFQGAFHLSQEDWTELNEKYKQLVEDRQDTLKEITDSLVNTYNKQLDFSMESNKKLFSELTSQMEKALRQNMEFHEETIKTYGEAPKVAKKESFQHAKPI